MRRQLARTTNAAQPGRSRRTLPASRSLLRLGATAAAAGALTLVSATGAFAHVAVHPGSESLVAGTASSVVLTFDHGCDGSPTKALALKVPDGITSITPKPASGWSASPATKDGVDQVVFTADPAIPSGVEVSLEMTVLPAADSGGKSVVFPVVQTCEKGETAWVQLPKDGQSATDLDHPASVLAVAAAADGTVATASTTGASSSLGIVGLVAGVAGVIAAAVATAAARRRHREPV